jgi:hypothetical protein
MGQWARDPVNASLSWRGDRPVEAASRSMFATTMAGLDNMRLFAFGLGSVPPVAVSLVTVARSALEAFGRVHWVLGATDAGDLIARVATLELADLTYLIRNAAEENAPSLVVARDETTISAVGLQRQIRGDLSRLGLKPYDSPSRTKLVSELLDAALQREGGRVRYSTLSAISHGESYAVNAFLAELPFVDGGETGTTVALRVPRDTAIDCAVYLASACVHVHTQLISLCGLPLQETERWEQICARAGLPIHHLATSR